MQEFVLDRDTGEVFESAHSRKNLRLLRWLNNCPKHPERCGLYPNCQEIRQAIVFNVYGVEMGKPVCQLDLGDNGRK